MSEKISTPVAVLLESFLGSEIMRALTFSMLALTIYDYALTLDKEVLHFWKGPFTISYALFFFNRYAPVCVIVYTLILSFLADPTIQFCSISINISMYGNFVAIGVIQAILVTRVWFLFPGQKAVQFGLVFFFMMSLAAQFFFLFLSISHLPITPFPISIRKLYSTVIFGCPAGRPPAFWRVYVPSLILHTGLYVMTAYHAITNWDDWHQTNLRKRLIRDGGVFYFVVFFTVGLTFTGSYFNHSPLINLPATFSPLVLSITSIVTNRILFNLRDITAKKESSLKWTPMNFIPTEVAYHKEAKIFNTEKTNIWFINDEEKGGAPEIFQRVGCK